MHTTVILSTVLIISISVTSKEVFLRPHFQQFELSSPDFNQKASYNVLGSKHSNENHRGHDLIDLVKSIEAKMLEDLRHGNIEDLFVPTNALGMHENKNSSTVVLFQTSGLPRWRNLGNCQVLVFIRFLLRFIIYFNIFNINFISRNKWNHR